MPPPAMGARGGAISAIFATDCDRSVGFPHETEIPHRSLRPAVSRLAHARAAAALRFRNGARRNEIISSAERQAALRPEISNWIYREKFSWAAG